jgi:hypothetical protein
VRTQQNSPSLTDSLRSFSAKGVPIRETIPETKVPQESVNMHRGWEEAYRAAVLETDNRQLIDRIDSARTVLRESLLEANSSLEHISERQRIEDALRTLDMIRRIQLQIPT